MAIKETTSYKIAYKWLSWGIVILFVYYWVVSIALAFFYGPVSAVTPRHTFFFRTFSRQNWRLFAVTKGYNRQMFFIVRDKNNPQNCDTTDLTQYLLSQRRKHRFFDNSEDGLERTLYSEMNAVESWLVFRVKKLREKNPGQSDTTYIREAIDFVVADSLHQQNINNLAGFGRYVMDAEKKSMEGKEYRLLILRKYIAPEPPRYPTHPGGNEELVFITPYKSL